MKTEEENNTIVTVLDEIVDNIESEKIKLEVEESKTFKNRIVKFFKNFRNKLTCLQSSI